MTPAVKSIKNTLSLREPQTDALGILDDLAREILDFGLSNGDLGGVDRESRFENLRSRIAERYPSFTSFEREFPNLCFALATGVGKTRLMGAFMAYLYREHGVRHFMILAPNLTIYEKLKRDLSSEGPKYVFRGISEFAVRRPLVITGDDYQGRNFDFDDLANSAVVNLFNIAKITGEMRGGNVPRIRRFAEYLGQSYFDYLAGLQDLVVIMDEAHRYRASAGMQAINDLRPRLGLELTATPRRGGQEFRDVVYSYPLGAAMRDGLVKEPTAVTRLNFSAVGVEEGELEKIKLEDGVTVHEETKLALEIYAKDRGETAVKPFMLVVAGTIDHARKIRETVEGAGFFGGRYAGKVTEVHSSMKADEEAKMVERLLKVEDPNEPTEIVIHVNQLNEGWDVTNLYTIVPLRASASQILTEQTIGRGLRLPFGRRTGDPTLDALNIVAHERFQEIIDRANDPDSLIRAQKVVGRDVTPEAKATVTVSPVYVPSAEPPTVLPFESEEERAVATVVSGFFEELPYVAKPEDLLKPEIQERLVRETRAKYDGAQPALAGTAPEPDIAKFVERQTRRLIARFIVIPEIIVVPTGEVRSGFGEFDLDVSGITQQPVSDDVLLHALHSGERRRLTGRKEVEDERFIENYVVRHLVDFDDVSYDRDSELLYKLVGQIVAKLRTYLDDEKAVRNVMQTNQKRYAELVHTQMLPHFWRKVGGFETRVGKNFPKLLPLNYGQAAGSTPVPYTVTPKSDTELKRSLYGGFKRAIHPYAKFDSLPELRMARLLEQDVEELIWLRPAPGQFRIYTEGSDEYRPDFVAQTDTETLLIEVKATKDLEDLKVQAKAMAASLWCRRATEVGAADGAKPWRYLLIPDGEIRENTSLQALAENFEYGADSL